MNHLDLYSPWRAFYGDIHNHCNISYGHGSLEDAYANARLQLDFASVTGHAWWHDMPPAEGRLAGLVRYHQRGFERLERVWDDVQDVTEGVHEDGRFVSFLSFEWHSCAHGDHCFYYPGGRGELIREPSIARMRERLRELAAAGTPMMMIPHHICYLDGYRGINWDDFDPEFTPVVEMVSMHGCGEHDDAPRPYLHSMGPRDARSSLLAGLRRGLRFGVIGSSDHHAAHPGSHGHGRMSVWADDLSRAGIWEAIHARRTCALTGDRIELAFAVNGVAMGGHGAAAPQREIAFSVRGEGPLDYVDIVRNGETIHRYSGPGRQRAQADAFHGLLGLSLGWGERYDAFDWDVTLEVIDGELLQALPRFKGDITVSPQADEHTRYHVSRWRQSAANAIAFTTRTTPNANVFTDCTQGFGLRVRGDGATRLRATLNGHRVEHCLAELRDGPRAGYVDGFVSPAWQFHRAVPDEACCWRHEFSDPRAAGERDWYYARVRQTNDQWAWSSPVHVG